MMFWIICLALTCLAIALFGFALMRAAPNEAGSGYDLQVYKDQLAEVDRDLERGVIQADDAERVRTEIARRIISADAARTEIAVEAKGTPVLVLVAIGAVVLAGSFGIYTQFGAPGYGDLPLSARIEIAQTLRATRPAQEIAEAAIDPNDLPPVAPPSAEYIRLIDGLRKKVAQNQDDPQGQLYLAIVERELGHYSASHQAYAKYIEILGEKAGAEEYMNYAESLMLAAGGYVSPQAEAALKKVFELDPRNGAARYYWGLMLYQTGRPDQSFHIWDALLREGPAEAPWIPPIDAQIEEAAYLAGVNYVKPTPGSARPRGPSGEDVAAAAEMSPQDRMQMIEGMVTNLSERLANEGGSVDEWAQLITALGVLSRWEDARRVYTEAVQVFADDPSALDHINHAGQQAGIAE